MRDDPALAFERLELALGSSLAVSTAPFALDPFGWRVQDAEVHRQNTTDGEAGIELAVDRPEQCESSE
jgi:hypothetical protein